MERKGICKNVGVCTMAGKVQVITDDDAELKCAECGENLEPYKEEPVSTGGGKKKSWIILILIAILLIGLGSGAYLLFGGSSKPEAIKLNKEELTMKVGDTITISPTIEPEGVKATFIFKKKGKNIEVNSDGQIAAKEKGEAAILVKCEENPEIRAICKIKVEEQEKPIIEPQPEGIDKTNVQTKEPKKKESKQVRTGYVSNYNIGYGKYTGDIVNGQPHGHGTITYTTTRRIVSSQDYVAHPGDRFEGDFRNGTISGGIGYWYHDGETTGIRP